ncbi:hypothetical protein AAFF_G00019010 [Aldrovandia affinis]|uniref:Uncharacterized protein n=1 Tax=Aldrovandia affinis TaxID=143900 RepID=A0AAD7S5L5_9TELE|nr:hypothetical protein AAFF_G00019010 [Aldrovandia affinis]
MGLLGLARQRRRGGISFCRVHSEPLMRLNIVFCSLKYWRMQPFSHSSAVSLQWQWCSSDVTRSHALTGATRSEPEPEIPYVPIDRLEDKSRIRSPGTSEPQSECSLPPRHRALRLVKSHQALVTAGIGTARRSLGPCATQRWRQTGKRVGATRRGIDPWAEIQIENF